MHELKISIATAASAIIITPVKTQAQVSYRPGHLILHYRRPSLWFFNVRCRSRGPHPSQSIYRLPGLIGHISARVDIGVGHRRLAVEALHVSVRSRIGHWYMCRYNRWLCRFVVDLHVWRNVRKLGIVVHRCG